MAETMEEVVIAGGGIAGMATAVALKRVGIRAMVLEKSQVLRSAGAAISLSAHAWLALDALGVSHKLSSLYAPIPKGSVTNISSGSTQEILLPKTRTGGTRLVLRRNLLEALAHELPPDSIRFSSKITSIDIQQHEGAPICTLHLQDGTTIRTKILIGCDGVRSVVANCLGLKKPIHAGRSAVRGLAVYPQGHGHNGVKHFVDPGKRGIFIPLNDKEIYWSFFFQGETSLNDPRMIQNEVIENQAKNFPPIFLDVVQHSDLSSLTCVPLTLRHPWHIIFGNFRKGNVTVAGDAMHPMTPELGQGGGSALEDAVVLGRHIGNSFLKNGKIVANDIGVAIDGYIEERRWRVAGLVTGSYLSGCVLQDGSNWFTKFLRDAIFFRFYAKLLSLLKYDCGKLPVGSIDGHDNFSKND